MIEKLQAHYGFSRMPFGRNLAPGMLHRHASHNEAVARISWCISERAIGVITGEVGAGKTVSVRTVLASLDPSRHTVVYLPNPMIGIRGICEEILATFGQPPSHLGSRLFTQTSKALMAEREERGRTPVLVLDEGHLLAYEQLETIRMLTLCRDRDYAGGPARSPRSATGLRPAARHNSRPFPLVTVRPRWATLVLTVPQGHRGEELHVVTRGPSQVRVAGPLAPHADGFRAALDARGFSPWSQMFYLHLLADVSRWLGRHGLDASGLTDANASAFRQDRRSRGRARFRGMQGLALLLSFLRNAGAVPPPAAAEPGDEAGVMVAEFAGYLAGERGLRPQTVILYSASVRRFLDSLPAGDGDVLAGLTADAVRSFVIAESSRRGTGSLKNQVTAVRSLLRFLHLRGRIPAPMDGAAPAAAGWHRPPLTRRIRPGDVAAILASCDRDTHAGRRDYAILMLLARLGLRAGEAAAARVGDIDWRSGEILVRGKGGRDERLPLPSDVGAAIADYCRNARPEAAASGMLFLHVRAPYGPVSPSTVGNVVVRACRRAGLEPASAHQLRHAAATAMRRAGAPLSEISQLLRHRHEGTTSRYGTIDPDELGPVTAPWPGGAS